MSFISVDVESDGDLLGTHSMVCFGAVLVEDMTKTFYGKTKPISNIYIQKALNISGFTREQHEEFDDPKEVMLSFAEWIKNNSKGRPIFITDNPAYDFSWINWYFITYIGQNPFGFSARRIGDMYCGFENNLYYTWKHHRITKHTHNPVDDAKGNAEAFLYLTKKFKK